MNTHANDIDYARQWYNALHAGKVPDTPDPGKLNGLYPIFSGAYEVLQARGLEPALAYLATPAFAEYLALLEAPTTRVWDATEYMERLSVNSLSEEIPIPERGLTAFIGQPGSGKSLIVKRLIAQMAYDMPVLMVVGEGHGGVPARLRAEQRALGKPLSKQFYIYDEDINLKDTASVAAFIELIQPLGIKAIVFDTFAACTAGVDENSTKDMTQVIANCKQIVRELDTAIILVHHSTKDGANYRGSSAFHGAMDAMYFLSEDDDLFTLTCKKLKDGEQPDPKHYRLVVMDTGREHPQTGKEETGAVLLPADKVVADDSGEGLSGNQKKVLEALDGFEHGLRHRALMDATSLAKSSLHNALKLLIKTGYVTQHESGEPYTITEQGQAAISRKNAGGSAVQ